MKIYFVRHGQTEDNVNKIIRGHTETVLTEEGRKQVEEALKLISRTCSVIYSSPLIRTKQTTEILNEELNLPIIFDGRLREVHFGSLEGRPRVEMDEETYLKLEYDYRHLGGESVEDMKARVLNFVNEIKMKHSNEEVIAVTSAGIIKVAHLIFNNKIHEIIHNASIHEFEFQES